MSAKAKYAVIYRHREKYSVLVMCRFFSVSRSGYYSFVRRLNRPEKDASLAEKIRNQQDKCFHTYGYRRMWQWLKNSEEIIHNPKTILRVMKKYGLLSEIRRRRRWQQMGQQLHKYQNLLNRNFQAEAPNRKWVTDISYIQTKQGVLYLSMIRDLYDNSIVACKTATQQTVNLGLDPTAAAAAIVISGWCGHFLPIDGMPAMIMGTGNYKIGEFWKFTIPQYFIRLLALTIGAVLIFPMR